MKKINVSELVPTNIMDDYERKRQALKSLAAAYDSHLEYLDDISLKLKSLHERADIANRQRKEVLSVSGIDGSQDSKTKLKNLRAKYMDLSLQIDDIQIVHEAALQKRDRLAREIIAAEKHLETAHRRLWFEVGDAAKKQAAADAMTALIVAWRADNVINSPRFEKWLYSIFKEVAAAEFKFDIDKFPAMITSIDHRYRARLAKQDTPAVRREPQNYYHPKYDPRNPPKPEVIQERPAERIRCV